MKKYSLLLLSTLLGVSLWSCSDDKDEAVAVVGITSASVTPQGSAVAYMTDIDQTTGQITNVTDPVAWDVTDAQLANTTVKVTSTVGATVYYQNTAIPEDGLVIDVTSPVTLVARDAAGTSRSYTLNVTRATEAAQGQSLVLKSSSFMGFPAGVVYYDMTMFKGKFYASVVSVDGDNENYQIFNSEDGVNWTEVDYKCAGNEKFVVGGEGARLAVLNDRLLVIGGARTKGADKYGNPAEIEDGWFGPSPTLNTVRVYSSADGETFSDDSSTVKYYGTDGTEKSASQLANAYMLMANFNGKLFIKGGFQSAFGMLQGRASYVMTSDGKNFYDVDTTPADLFYIKGSQANAFFVFKNKLWIVGGFKSFISASQALDVVYSSADGVAWNEEGTLPAELSGLCFASVVANDEAVILIGGQFVTTDGNVMNSKMYRSTDCVTWDEIDVTPNYVGRRSASTVTVGNVGWIFGGYKNLSSGNYGWPDGDGAELLSDTWVKLID